MPSGSVILRGSMVVPFRRERRQRARRTRPSPADTATRFRLIVDRWQVLALSQPRASLWLLEWLEQFFQKQLG